MVKTKYANNTNNLKSKLRELNKIQVINKNLHEIKNEILLNYEGEFEMIGNLKVGDQLDKRILDLELFLIMKLIANLLMKVMTQKKVFLMVIFKNSILLSLT